MTLAAAPAVVAASGISGTDLAVIAGVLLGYAAVRVDLRGTPITPAIVFVTTGLLLGVEGADVVTIDLDAGAVHVLAEITLTLVLFSDAASLPTRALTREASIPLRLLLVGLPLTIALGVLAGLPLFGGLGAFEILILAVILAPTDAALGEAVVSDQRIPSAIRHGLNVESGLNDGICVPLLYAALAFAELEQAPQFDGGVLVDLVTDLAVATGVGLGAAVLSGAALQMSMRRRWIEERWTQVVPVSAVVIAYTVTAELGGSGFVAAFVAGLAYRRFIGAALARRSLQLTDEIGGALSAVTFFVFGAAIVGPELTGLDAKTVLYAALSLTIVRMVPVALALWGTRSGVPTVAFTGWFGPRGLATIVFALTVVEEADLAGTPVLLRAAACTVLLSVFAHGLSAPFLTAAYAAWSAGRTSGGDDATDHNASGEVG